jgi:hypothetical protein
MFFFWRGGDKDSQHNTAVPAGFQTSQLVLHAMHRVSDKYGFTHLLCDRRRPGDTVLFFYTHPYIYTCISVLCILYVFLSPVYSMLYHVNNMQLSHLFCIYFSIVTLFFTPQGSVETLTTTFVSTCSKQQIPDNLFSHLKIRFRFLNLFRS